MIFLLYLSIPIGIDPVETNEACCANTVGGLAGGAREAGHGGRHAGSRLSIAAAACGSWEEGVGG
jgi:hypothetical protein